MHLKVKPRPWSDVPRRRNAQFALAQLAGNQEARKIEPSILHYFGPWHLYQKWRIELSGIFGPKIPV